MAYEEVTSPIILDSTGQQIHSDLQQIKNVLTTPSAAEDITFDNTGTGMQADDVQDAITELKSNLTQLNGLTVYRNLTPQTSYASFNDGSNLPLISLTTNIDPIQDLHGYDHPWSGGAGKNKLEVTATSETINGVTFTVNSDGTIKVNGTATANVRFVIGEYILKAGSSVRLNGSPVDGSASTIALGYQGYGIVSTANSDRVCDRTSASKDWDNDVYISVTSGYTANNLTFKPMMRLATETDPTFEPYSNICPISGFTEANVTRCGKNLAEDGFDWNINADGIIENITLYNTSIVSVRKNESYIQTINGVLTNIGVIAFYYERPSIGSQSYNKSRIVNLGSPIFTAPIDGYAVIRNAVTDTNIQIEKGNTATDYEPYNGQTYTVEFTDGSNPLTVYGGTLDVVSGELTVTDEYIASYNGETLPATWISDRDVYAEGTTPTTGAEVVYELGTPQTYQLTPTQVNSLLGQNYIFSDTGNVTNVKYIGVLNFS